MRMRQPCRRGSAVKRILPCARRAVPPLLCLRLARAFSQLSAHALARFRQFGAKRPVGSLPRAGRRSRCRQIALASEIDSAPALVHCFGVSASSPCAQSVQFPLPLIGGTCSPWRHLQLKQATPSDAFVL